MFESACCWPGELGRAEGLRWGAIQALRETNFVSLARSRMLFVLLLHVLRLFSVSIAKQRVGRFFGDSENDCNPFRLCVVLVTGTCTSTSWKESGRIDGKVGRDD